MKKKNKMTKSAYWLEIVFLTLVLDILFYFWGFKNCFFLDRRGSVIFAIILDLIMIAGLGFVAMRHYRNNLSIWCTVLLPIEIYNVISYFTVQTWRVLLLLVVWVLSVITWLLIKSHQSLKNGEEFKVNAKTLPMLIRMGWILITLVFLMFLLPILSRGAQGIEVALDYTILKTDTKGFTVTGQQMNLVKLDESTWKKLDKDQREEMLQLLADIESNELGLPFNLYIGLRDFSDYEVNAAYTTADHKILINQDIIEKYSGEEMIELICHQAYHAYERTLVDFYMESDRSYQSLAVFGNVENYLSELQLDMQALDDRRGAKNEKLEASAVEYAKDKKETYLYWIDFAKKSGN